MSTSPLEGEDGRLNMLVSYGGWRTESWADLLPRLMEPMGVRTWRADSGREAERLIREQPVHIAVVDWRLPLEPRIEGAPTAPAQQEGGARLLKLLARVETRPPTVVVKPARSARHDERDLAEALALGAFTVVDRPVDLELLLEVFRRVLRRHYQDRWPTS